MLIMFESLLAIDKFSSDLSSHKLKGRTEGRWLLIERIT